MFKVANQFEVSLEGSSGSNIGRVLETKSSNSNIRFVGFSGLQPVVHVVHGVGPRGLFVGFSGLQPVVHVVHGVGPGELCVGF